MRFTVLLTETQSDNPDEIVYVNCNEKNDVLRLNSSLKPSQISNKFVNVLKEVFLPQGYPYSVSEDYTNYQLWDTLQASCSTITGTLVTHEILRGIGVGDAAASSISAAITWVMKDGMGMLSRIIFTWFVSTGLDAECKKWRMFADIINDLALSLELFVLPMFNTHALKILCVSTSLKAIVGIAGGATRAAITQHQAIKQNMADVSAKDASQETCVNLISSFLGLALLSTFGNSSFIWFIFFILTVLHVYSNYNAVKSLNFNFFNEERLAIFIREYLIDGVALTPVELNTRESVFLGLGITGSNVCGYKIKIGHSVKDLMKKSKLPGIFQFFSHLYKDRKYMVLLCVKQKSIYIVLAINHSQMDIIEAYFHAVLFGIGASYINSNNRILSKLKYETETKGDEKSILAKLLGLLVTKKMEYTQGEFFDISTVISIDELAKKEFPQMVESAQSSGWDVERHLLHFKKWKGNWVDSNRKIDVTSQLNKDE